MFLGAIPPDVLAQFLGSIEALPHDDIYVCCSGSFRMERAIASAGLNARMHSNDVSLYSNAIGRWLAGGGLEYTFKGELEPLEYLLTNSSPRRRAAGVIVALELAKFGKQDRRGGRNAYKVANWNNLMANAGAMLEKAEVKLTKAFDGVKLEAFHGRDWLQHLEEGVARGATIAAEPPFIRDGNATLIRWIDARCDWERPRSEPFDAATMPGVITGLVERGANYSIISDRKLDGCTAGSLYQASQSSSYYGYTSADVSFLDRKPTRMEAFVYKPLDLDKLHRKSKIEIAPLHRDRAMYIRSIFLKKSIQPARGTWDFAIQIDDMLAGVLCYDLDEPYGLETQYGSADGLYLLSDVSCTRDGRVSKLIARLATNALITDFIAARTFRRIVGITTTAFSDHPASMKYRGIWELATRREADPPAKGYVLQYNSAIRQESLRELYVWWWNSQRH